VDASLLGFSVSASTDRINVGERDFVDGMWIIVTESQKKKDKINDHTTRDEFKLIKQPIWLLFIGV
jgi:hypothetical protein